MCEIHDWQGLVLVGFAILEYWLGKTDRLEAGSTLELILNGAKSLLGLVRPK